MGYIQSLRPGDRQTPKGIRNQRPSASAQPRLRRFEAPGGRMRRLERREELAERGGFEPPVEALIPYNRLAICPVQPLQHLSARGDVAGTLRRRA